MAFHKDTPLRRISTVNLFARGGVTVLIALVSIVLLLAATTTTVILARKNSTTGTVQDSSERLRALRETHRRSLQAR